MAKPRPTFILLRGAYDKPGEAVTADTPAVLPPMAPALPRNRLGLARWLVDPRNPLPARVTVNRLWQSRLRHRPGENERGLRRAGRAA